MNDCTAERLTGLFVVDQNQDLEFGVRVVERCGVELQPREDVLAESGLEF